MFALDIVTELVLALDACEFARLLQRDGVRAVEDGVPSLHVQQVQLDGVARVDVLIGEEELAAQQHRLGLVNALLAQRLGRVDPVDFVVCLQLLAQLLHFGVALASFLLAPLQRKGAVVARLVFQLVFQQLAH